MLLFPDPRPLVERLGTEFFRTAPDCPGVYLMRDATDVVLYVGKAKNLRKRLTHYRVANPDRMPRRHLRMLRAVVRIELRQCSDEATALATEAELLRSLRPRFNRAGTWVGPPRFLLWRTCETAFEFAEKPAVESGWRWYGPLGAAARPLRVVLCRLVWSALHPQRGLAQMPVGWFHAFDSDTTCIPRYELSLVELKQAQDQLTALLKGGTEQFAAWIRQRSLTQFHPFELAVRENDLEALGEFMNTKSRRIQCG